MKLSKKTIFFLTFKIFIINLFLFHNDIKASGNRTHLNENEVAAIHKFREKGKYGNLKKITPFDPQSTYAKSIIFLKSSEKTCPLVIKIFKDIKSYHKEKKQLKETILYIRLVNKLGANCPYTLPKIMEYKGSTVVNNEGSVLLTKAKGKTLKEFIKKTSIYDNEKLKDVFFQTGYQLGTLNGLFFKKNDKEILFHPDDNSRNYIYDIKKKQLYMIDTAGMKIKKVNSVDINDHGILLGFKVAIKFAYQNLNEPPEDLAKKRSILLRNTIALRSFFKGYAEGLTGQGVTNNIKSEYNHLIQSEEFVNSLKKCNEISKRAGFPEIPLEKLNE